jgi:DNA-binding response OmpR family regulator
VPSIGALPILFGLKQPGCAAYVDATMTPVDIPSKFGDSPPIVLVIEKDVLIHMSVSAYLRDCGFKVLEATGADEAMSILQTEAKISVVFSDVGIAGGGFGLAQWVRRERPDAKIILSSGLKRSTEEAGRLCEEGPHREQPYDHALLERRIRQLLAGQT